MEYEDRLVIGTPEGVDLDLRLAGLGSRFVAALLDVLLRLVVFAALGLVLLAGPLTLDDLASGIGLALFSVGAFLVLFGYDVLFEVLASGRTPGKRRAGLRVVLVDGRPVTFTASALRTIVRVVDLLPGPYLVGAAAILLTRRNQRLGDLAAGTLVVREEGSRAGDEPPFRVPEAAAGWDVAGIGTDELVAVRRFLARRAELTPESRRALAATLAGRLRPRVVAPDAPADDEHFLELVAVVKGARR
jgi:uncharacterized RDD family membrane protein YckC